MKLLKESKALLHICAGFVRWAEQCLLIEERPDTLVLSEPLDNALSRWEHGHSGILADFLRCL